MAESILLPEVVYATFIGDIGPIASQRFNALYTHIIQQKSPLIREVHLLLHSMGGTAHDGIFIYNLFKALPVPLSIYNGASVGSAAATAYLGGHKRFTVENGLFMIHRVTSALQARTTYEGVYSLAESVRLDDTRSAQIYEHELVFTDAQKEKYMKGVDCWLTAAQAIDAKLAHSLGGFSPPMGTPVLNLER